MEACHKAEGIEKRITLVLSNATEGSSNMRAQKCMVAFKLKPVVNVVKSQPWVDRLLKRERCVWCIFKMFMKKNTEGAGAGAESSFLGQERLKHHR